MWFRFFHRIAFENGRRYFGAMQFRRAAFPPTLLWLFPQWMRQKPLQEEDVEPNPLLRLLKKGKLAEMKKDYFRSEELYHNGLKLLHEQFESGSVDESEFTLIRLQILTLMANAAYARKDYEVAEVLFKQCIQGFIRDLGYSTEHLGVVDASLKLAIIYAAQGNKKDAEIGYEFCIKSIETIAIVKKAFDDDLDELTDDEKNSLALYGMCLDAFARFLINSERFFEAVPLAHKAYKVSELIYNPKHPTRLLVSVLFALSLVESGDIEKGLSILLECSEIASREIDQLVKLKNQNVFVQNSSAVIDDANEIELAHILCACKCNSANALFRLISIDEANGADRNIARERQARRLCYEAKQMSIKYNDEKCNREIIACLAKFLKVC